MSMSKQCEWSYDDEHFAYDTECDNKFVFIEDGIEENNFKHCPYCGGEIIEGPPINGAKKLLKELYKTAIFYQTVDVGRIERRIRASEFCLADLLYMHYDKYGGDVAKDFSNKYINLILDGLVSKELE